VAQDSWFPGYAWTVAYCSACFAHMGWRFTPVTRGRALSGAQSFWGLRRGQLTDEARPAAAEEANSDEGKANSDEEERFSEDDSGTVDEEENEVWEDAEESSSASGPD